VPLEEIQKSNLILFDRFSPELMDTPYYKSLRLWISCISLGTRDAVSDRFDDVHIIDPGSGDWETAADEIAEWFYRRDFRSIDSVKFRNLGRILSDVTNIIDHARKSRRKNPVVNHLHEVLGKSK
jgi:hypothetical protein